ncbi:NADH-cytochrome b5 reductase 1 [Nadsonia fulvescens var. elongata DSM 6958]|uniref:NADH-cytochrome b5 reductase n=1 Tax=Nadsonia fulvescens var. elongata DSM 6958 TaxID=857566 RepID=A0A1E3PM70_9ASCO|nr:NADH-cytochrome b5 reductase 1 [Nadsonia fulvescens var. elongata DSM 6958]
MTSFLAVGVTLVLVVAAAIYWQMSSSQTRKVLDQASSQFQEFPLIEKTVLSHNSAIYRFGLPRASDILGLPIGQHVSIQATISGKDIMRSYTPTSSDEFDHGYFDLLIKAYPNGNISKYVSELAIGDTIKVRGPRGQFRYQRGLVEEFTMVAGGTGITPMYQIMRAIAADPEDKTRVNLIFANVNYDDILLKNELDELAAQCDNINVFYVLNNPPEGWTGGVGFVTKDILTGLAADASRGDAVKLLLCGPPPMVSAIKKAAVDLGYAKARPVSKLEDQIFAF